VELRSGKIEEYLCNKPHNELAQCLRVHEVRVKALNGLELFSLVPQENEFFLRSRAEWQLQLCERFNIELLVLVPGVLQTAEQSSEWIVRESIRNLSLLIPLAERRGVRLGLEIVGSSKFTVRTVERALAIIEGTDPKRVGLVLDTICLYEGGNGPRDLEAIPSDRIVMLHVNDVTKREPREYRLEERMMPGRGDLELRDVFNVLKQKQYGGPVSVEVFNEDLWRKPPTEVAREAWQSLDQYLGK
jgi:sugar phosphate isomerase/epimerase